MPHTKVVATRREHIAKANRGTAKVRQIKKDKIADFLGKPIKASNGTLYFSDSGRLHYIINGFDQKHRLRPLGYRKGISPAQKHELMSRAAYRWKRFFSSLKKLQYKIGSKEEVFFEIAKQTPGGLTRSDLVPTNQGKVTSKVLRRHLNSIGKEGNAANCFLKGKFMRQSPGHRKAQMLGKKCNRNVDSFLADVNGSRSIYNETSQVFGPSSLGKFKKPKNKPRTKKNKLSPVASRTRSKAK